MAKSKFIIKLFPIIYSILILLSGCANQLPPGGGDVDTVAPFVAECYPKDGTILYKENYFEFDFSEYIDKRSFKDALFISPAIEGEMEFDFSGTGVRVSFDSELKKDITYNIVLGTDIVDINNRNRMDKAFSLSFSTGEKIDKGIIRGIVYDEKPSGVMIYAYKTNVDTLDPVLIKPDYISQVGEKGDFTLTGLAEGTYRVFAVKDEYRDLIFQPDQDKIGVPRADVFVRQDDTIGQFLTYSVTAIDTVAPRLLGAVMTDQKHILASFSEPIRSSNFSNSIIKISDSVTNISYPFTHYYKGKSKEKDIIFYCTETIPKSDQYFLEINNFSDNDKNICVFDKSPLIFSERADTGKISLLEVEPKSGSSGIDFIGIKFLFQFDQVIDTTVLTSSNIQVTDSSKRTKQYKYIMNDESSFYIQMIDSLESSQNYTISMDLNKMPQNKQYAIDSVYKYKFSTGSDLDFTAIYGKIDGINDYKDIVVVLQKETDVEYSFSSKIAKDGVFAFERILPGKYKIYCFLDKNHDGLWTHGFPYPFTPSEPKLYMKEAVNAPARWAVTDVFFDLSVIKDQ